MGAKRVKDLLAMALVGDGVLTLIAPYQRALLWHFGPERLRKLTRWQANHPLFMRLEGLASIAIGVWLALRQYEEVSPPRPWYRRWFSEYRLAAGGLTSVGSLVAILLSVFLYKRTRSEAAGNRTMINLPSPFKSPEGEAEFLAAYEATMNLWPVPYEPMDIAGRYGRTYLVASGPEDAPPLVLLHMFFTSLTQWAANIADLSQDYRIYAIDVMGQPSKSIPDQPIQSREDYVAWLSELLDALNIESTNLVGASFGGWLTLNYALGAPERLNKIALLSPAGGLVPLVKQFYVRGMLMRFFPWRFVADSFVRWSTYEENLLDPNTRAIWWDCIADQFYLGVRHFRMQAGVRPDAFSDEELRSMQVPTLLLIGQQEAYYDPQAALERARRLIPNFDGELIPGANHEMTISKHEIVDGRVLEFLKENSPHPQSVGANG